MSDITPLCKAVHFQLWDTDRQTAALVLVGILLEVQHLAWTTPKAAQSESASQQNPRLSPMYTNKV